MTKEIFRDDAYAQSCTARVMESDERGVILDQTVFYAEGGGQPGDIGTISGADGSTVNVIGTYKDRDGRGILHVLADGESAPAAGSEVTAEIDWDRRYKHMRMHSCLHLLCSLVDGGVTGGSISVEKSRLDFDLQDVTLDKEALTDGLNKLVEENYPLSASWITDEEMEAQQDLVRTMSVKPPTGSGRVRLMHIEGVDLQPCGGTHVKASGEIGAVRVSKIENKGAHNRRVNIVFVKD
ncbi:MAG: alanyl-tRNA editing protein [Gammaproteobacteria bacterium]|nr:alanyl-tRNA editing protein [Gammaproteobacteria bacterium]MDD9895801.1 alanyl-tRNA editing protein [Gammaproteobacteria bacterium]